VLKAVALAAKRAGIATDNGLGPEPTFAHDKKIRALCVVSFLHAEQFSVCGATPCLRSKRSIGAAVIRWCLDRTGT